MVLVGGAVGCAPGRRAMLHAKRPCSLDALVCGSIPSALAEDPFDGAASLRRPSARSRRFRACGVVAQTQGRMRPIQLTPFECQTCYGGLVAGRHNLDLQDMRRVLDPALWLDSEEHLPHVGFTDSLGYMAWYEWNGKAYEVRSDAPSTSVSWLNRRDWAPDFRSAWLTAHQQFMEKEGEAVTSDAQDEDAPMPPAEDGQQDAEMATAEETDDSTAELTRAIRCGISEAFCDGINSGFYINSYTTKPGPGLAGMLEELQKGPQKVVFSLYALIEKMFCLFGLMLLLLLLLLLLL